MATVYLWRLSWFVKVILSMLFLPFQSSILSPCCPPPQTQFSLLILIFPFALNIVCDGTYVLLFTDTFDSNFLVCDHLLFKAPLCLPPYPTQKASATLRISHLAPSSFHIPSQNNAVPHLAVVVQQDMCACLLSLMWHVVLLCILHSATYNQV